MFSAIASVLTMLSSIFIFNTRYTHKPEVSPLPVRKEGRKGTSNWELSGDVPHPLQARSHGHWQGGLVTMKNQRGDEVGTAIGISWKTVAAI
jgi:hypothetical protein